MKMWPLSVSPRSSRQGPAEERGPGARLSASERDAVLNDKQETAPLTVGQDVLPEPESEAE